MKRQFSILLSSTILLVSLRAQATSDVLYHIDDDDAFSAVEQSPADAPPKKFMRDPDLNVTNAPALHQKKSLSKKAQISYVPAEHQFSPARISGKLRKPRVEFAGPKYQLSRLPDKLPKEFLNQPITVGE